MATGHLEKEVKQMANLDNQLNSLVLAEVREMLKDNDIVFMRQGFGARVHLSDGDCRNNNLLHGITYSRNGSRNSYIYPISFDSVPEGTMCRKCLIAFRERAEWIASKKVGA
jgi:hypothetical protein